MHADQSHLLRNLKPSRSCAGAGAGRSPLDGYTAGQTQQGAPAGSFALSGLETLNTANNQLSITIPVVTVQARGSVSVPLMVSLTSPMWDVTGSSYVYNCGPNSARLAGFTP